MCEYALNFKDRRGAICMAGNFLVLKGAKHK